MIPPGQDGASLEAEAISFTYPSAERAALHEVSLNLEPGQLGCLMGRTGAGKSTLSLCLNGIIPAMQAGEFKGIVRIGADSISAQPVHEIARRVGLLFQDFETQLLCSDVESEVAFGLENAQMPREQMQQRVTEMLELVGLNDLRGRDPATLSGGWKQRLALAAATVHEPELLFLDEPTAGVDPDSRRLFWEKLFDMAADGTTILVSTHYMDEAVRCHRLCLVRDGQRSALGSPYNLMASLKGRIVEIIAKPPDKVLNVLTKKPEVASATQMGNRLHILLEANAPGSEKAAAQLSSELKNEGFRVKLAESAEPNLEDVFVALIHGEAIENGEV